VDLAESETSVHRPLYRASAGQVSNRVQVSTELSESDQSQKVTNKPQFERFEKVSKQSNCLDTFPNPTSGYWRSRRHSNYSPKKARPNEPVAPAPYATSASPLPPTVTPKPASPNGSTLFIGSLPTYSYRVIPPLSPIGSRLIQRSSYTLYRR
jgi:hypothetical protein